MFGRYDFRELFFPMHSSLISCMALYIEFTARSDRSINDNNTFNNKEDIYEGTVNGAKGKYLTNVEKVNK